MEDDEAFIAFINFLHQDTSQTSTYKNQTIYCALLVRKHNKYPALIPLVTQKDLNNYFQQSRNTRQVVYISDYESRKKLYQKLWQPLEPYLKNVQTVHISPSGILNRLAFDVLDNGKDILIDKYKLAYYSTLRDFLLKNTYKQEIDKSVDGLKSIGAVGGALFNLNETEAKAIAIDSSLVFQQLLRGDTSRAGWKNLPGTLKEVQQIQQIFQDNHWNVKLLTKNYAIEDHVKLFSSQQSPDILHFAVHGYFFPNPQKAEYQSNKDNPYNVQVRYQKATNPLLRSGLIFTGANLAWTKGQRIKKRDDGILTAYEVSNMNLRNTELVVLSACETGLGDIHDGEGVFGLQRAFKMAGVQSVIMSLWKVDDRATQELMVNFYQNYLKGLSKYDALYQAKMVIRQKYKSPAYWAGFILIE